MTSPALQVADILRDGQECARLAREAWDNGTNDREYVKEVCNTIDEALALLEAEQPRVPEDRERLAIKLLAIAGSQVNLDSDRVTIREAAALIRLPASAEATSGAEEMRERAAKVARDLAGMIDTGPEITQTSARIFARDAALDIEEVIRALPVDPETKGGWRPIVDAPKDGHRILISGNNRGITWITTGYFSPAHGSSWKPDEGSGTLQNPTHWQPLPAPPTDLPAQETKT